MFIQDLGWTEYFAALWNSREQVGWVPARVVAQQRGLWRVTGDFPECWAAPSGKLREQTEGGGDWPTVGDWVAVETCTGEPKAIIQEVLQRRSLFLRKEPGRRIAEQAIAANIDKAVVVAALDREFSLRRIERYMAQTWDSGASPVIVLNKADVMGAVSERMAEVEELAMGTPVFVLSARTGAGVEAFEASLAKRQTIVFLGSSGVGKSTLVNRLLREDRQATKTVRESDSRGRHTTTARQLFSLPNRALVIDTPGLRELQLWDAADGVSQTFADIEALGEQCRFRDCQHQNEPDCAVRAALEQGEFDGRRLASMQKLKREQEFLLRKMDPEKQHEHKKRIKILFRAIRRDGQSRDKGKH